MTFWTFFPLILMLVLFFLNLPVAYAMIVAGATYFLFAPNSMSLNMMMQKMISANSSFTYLAIPFFICAGVVFDYAGITSRLMRLAELLVGHIQGGMAQVNILLSCMMGGLSGSANADAALESKMIVPEMEKLGYAKDFSTVVTVASSCITPIIPPGIILILYASASDSSVAKMFYAGYLPGIIITIAMMVMTYFISKKRGYKPSREHHAHIVELLKAIFSGLPALFVPFGLVMGLRLGMFTPTEGGAVCVAYSLIIGFLVYREIKISDLPKIVKESVFSTAGIMFILSGANVLSIYLTWERVPNLVSEAILSQIHTPVAFLLMVNILLLVIGMFFDGGAAMVLLAPLLVPAAQSLGIDLIHFGLVLSLNLTIAGMSPPFGNMMFVSTSITGTTIAEYAKACIPYMLLMIGCLLLFTYCPGIVMLLPNLLSR
ncbi:MAG: TRAP transporter large permease [Lachnospiraceae bacterium]|nr:TRAP transporter large permease [Lachnospiraceae bacterium]